MKKNKYNDSELAGNLFDKAIRWYTSGDSGKKEAAIDLFPKDMLEREIKSFKLRDAKEREKARDIYLDDTLKICKRMFPVGTLVWNDDGTDNCVNIIISEPYIMETEYRIPYDVYRYDDTFPRKTVVARAVRLTFFGNHVIDGNWGYTYVGLEKLLDNMKRTDDTYVNTKPIINLDELHERKVNDRNKELNMLRDDRDKTEAKLSDLNNRIKELESYDPYELTPDAIQKIVEQYKNVKI